MQKSESFIEGRIRWKSEGYNIPTKKTYFLEDGLGLPGTEILSEIGKPVLVSFGSETNFLVVGTQGIMISDENIMTIEYTNMERVTDVPMNAGERKIDLSCLVIELNSNEKKKVYPESGKSAFAIWNILKMLIQMS